MAGIRLEIISVSKIKRNEENPRLFFRQKELDELKLSIQENGLQVPISVYEEDHKFVLIDGERRWRTFKTLEKDKIPAIIQNKPTALENLKLMFNIHGLREQWDIFTIAMKIERVIKLYKEENEGDELNEKELSEFIGMPKSVIHRSKAIIALPKQYRTLLRTELEKPKKDQRFSEDFFIEMENSLRAVNNNFPETLEKINDVRDVLINKYLHNVINNVTDFRKLTKIATAHKNLSYSKKDTLKNLGVIFERNDIGIEEVYKDSVEFLYGDKRLLSTVSNLYAKLDAIDKNYLKKEPNLRETLEKLKDQIIKLLK